MVVVIYVHRPSALMYDNIEDRSCFQFIMCRGLGLMYDNKKDRSCLLFVIYIGPFSV